ncbi:MAG: hypothetical protein DMG28_03765 [Acidobacteria bacterium]|nr:MAG: hypothetical protein DMG28_03765 [Acidobacteriota bacterium]
MPPTCGLSPLVASLIFGSEATMAEQVFCTQCDKPETQCACERYCWVCKGQYGIRLCVDGLYYCPDCREACDVRVVDSRGA